MNLDAYLEARNGARYRYDAGLSADMPLRAVRASFPEIGRVETYREALETANSQRTPESERIYLRALTPFLAAEVLRAHEARADEEIFALEAQQSVALSSEVVPLREARRRVPLEPNADKRRADAQAVSAFLLTHRGPYARRVEAAFEGLRALGVDSFAALRKAFRPETEPDEAALLEDAKAVLTSTEDAYRDVLGYVLKRLDPKLRPLPVGDGGLPDLSAARASPALLEQYPPGSGLATLQRWLLEWGFHPTADGNLRIDGEDRAGKRGEPFFHAVRVPREVRVGHRPGVGGLLEYAELAKAIFSGLRLASMPLEAGLAERRLYDARVVKAYGVLAARAVSREGFARRYLGSPKAKAKEAARLSAFFALASLREVAARALYAGSLEVHGVRSQSADDFRAQLEGALFVVAPRGHALERVTLGLSRFDELTAHALGSALDATLEARFDQDYFRNPAASARMKGAFRSLERDELSGFLALLGSLTEPALSAKPAAPASLGSRGTAAKAALRCVETLGS